jgi:hypothetical protein
LFPLDCGKNTGVPLEDTAVTVWQSCCDDIYLVK